MQSEMQELIAAAEGVLKDKDRSLAPFVRLRNAAAAARASKGGWIDVKLASQYVGKRVLGCKGADHIEGMEVVENGPDAPYFVYLSDGDGPVEGVTSFLYPLPSPPLSVETPEVQK